MKRHLCWLIFLILAASAFAFVDPAIDFKNADKLDVIVILKDEPVAGFGAASAGMEKRREMIEKQQDKVLEKLNSGKGKFGAASNSGFGPGHRYAAVNGFSGKISEEEFEKLKGYPEVSGIYLDKQYGAFLDVSVPQINATNVWGMQLNLTNVTGAGQTVCVIDTGIDYNHTFLGSGWGNTVIGGYRTLNSGSDIQECAGNNTACFDDHNHGTHVAGIIASSNATYRGVAPDAKLIAVKALDSSGSGYGADIIAGIDWCVSNASRFNISSIVMSLGDCSNHSTYCNSDAIAPSINTAVGQGILVAVAAGNGPRTGCTIVTNTDGPSSPACIENATAVGAVSSADAISYQRGALFELMAPGVNIHSSQRNGGFFDQSGTSMAAPHVAASVALLQQFINLQNGTSLGVDALKNVLNNTGVRIDDTASSGYNFTRVDVYSAILSLDSAAPSGNYVLPAVNSSNTSYNYVTVQINTSEVVTAVLQFNNTNYSMTSLGSLNYQKTVTGLTKANYTYLVYLTDLAGNAATLDTYQVTVNNSAPNITSFTPNLANVSVLEEGSLYFNHSSSDAENDTLSYYWHLNSSLQGSSSDWNYTPSCSSEGSYTVTLTVSDSFLNDTNSWNLTVNDSNCAPVAYILEPSSTTAEFGSLTNFTTNSTDPDGGNLTYLWDFGDGNSSNQTNATYTYPAAGNYTVVLTVNDSVDAGNDSIFLTVDDTTSPVINSVSYSSSIYTGNDLTVSANITDLSNMGAVNLTYNGTTYAASGSEGNYTWTLSDPNNGSNSFEINATDNHSNKVGNSYAFTVNYCGDGTCQSGESCSADNSACNSGYACTGGCESTGGGGGGGSSGGGGGSSSSSSSSLPSKTFYYSSMVGGQNYDLNFGTVAVPFTQMSFAPSGYKNRVEIKVELVDNGPASLDGAYEYLKITLTNIEDSEIENSEIDFKVNKSWVESGGHDYNKISLYRYESSWKKMETSLVKEEGGFYYYSATVPGFSYFAIGTGVASAVPELSAAAESGVQELGEVPSNGVTGGGISIGGRNESAADGGEIDFKWWYGLFAIPLVLVVLVVLHFTRRKKPRANIGEPIGSKKGDVLKKIVDEHSKNN